MSFYTEINQRNLIRMDKTENLFLAKKYMVESICNAANIEGIAMTFPETQTICDGMGVAGKSVDEINAVCDMKRAYQWVMENIEKKVDIDTVKMINRIAGKFTVLNSGRIRTDFDEPIRVMIGDGKYYYPELPKSEELINHDLDTIQNKRGFDKYFDTFCYLAKSQLFSDGNKRTATIVTNMLMVQDGQGIFSIPANEKLDFYKKLTDYYESNLNKPELKNFLLEKCIHFNRTIKQYMEESHIRQEQESKMQDTR